MADKRGILGICNQIISDKKASYTLDDFILQDYIGSGGFGKVYKVKYKKTGEIYAAKVSIKKFEESSKEESINLSREVDILSKLNHPSILNFLYYSPINFKRKDKPTIITEYAPGGSLSDFLETDIIDNPNWDDTNKFIIIYGIAAAMSYLHSHNIIHRDLKPENILLDDFFYPKIADFGMSKFKELTQNRYNSISSTKGTPMYMSPEIWLEQHYSKKSDVYAFGIILNEICSNKRAFKKLSVYEIMAKVPNGHRPEISSKIPEPYKKLIEKCWSQNLNERPNFDSILNQLKNDKSFLTDKIDEDRFKKYVEYIEKADSSFQLYNQAYYIRYKSKLNEAVKQYSNIKLFPYKVFSVLEREESRELVLEAEKSDEKRYELAQCLIKGFYDFPFNAELGINYLRESINYKQSSLYYIKMLIKGRIIPRNIKKVQKLIKKYFSDSILKIYIYGQIFKVTEEIKDAIECFQSCLQNGIIRSAYELGKIYSNISNEQAFQMYRIGSAYGQIDCIYQYGLFLIEGDELNQIRAGIELLSRIANEGHTKANYALGQLYENHGQINESFKYYKKAAEKGHIKSLHKYCSYLKTIAKLVKQDDNKFLKYLKKACDKGDLKSIYLYATNIIETNPEEGIKYGKIAAYNGIIEAISFYATILIEGLYNSESNIEEAIKLLKIGIDKGDDDCMVLYGSILHKGKGVPINYEEAIKYYKMAIEKDNDDAMDNYAWMLEHGEGVPVNYEEAEKYYKMAIEKGNVYAINNYAIMLNQGKGIERNSSKALEMYKIAAEKGIPASMYNYANMLEKSDNIIDQKEAVKYFKLAAIKGDVPSMVKFGEKLLFGNGVAINKQEAARFFKMAADKGDIEGMKYYASMCLKGEGIEIDLNEALKYFKMAADLGDVNSMNQFGYTLLMIDRNNEDNLKLSLKYLKMAFEKGNIESAVNISTILLNGKGFNHDIDGAIKYLKIAVENGNVSAMYNLGFILLKELKDLENGLKFIKMAADNGLVYAMNKYAEILRDIYDLEKVNEIAKYFKLAADNGDVESMIDYAFLILNKEFKEADLSEAVKYLKIAADQHEQNAAKILVFLAKNEKVIDIDNDEIEKYERIANGEIQVEYQND